MEEIKMHDTQERAFLTKIDRDRNIWDSHPKPYFPSISLTGGFCALNCDYCKGRYLLDMISADDPENLYDTCVSLEADGARGVLLSGGYNKEGYLPIEPFLDSITRISQETNLFLSVHPGLVSDGLARKLGDAGIDLVDFNFIVDEEVIIRRNGIQKAPKDYKNTLNSLLNEISHVAPHILLGLSREGLKAGRLALNALSGKKISALVFLIIIPPSSSQSKNYEIPKPKQVGRLIAEARLNFPDIPLSLGCMRPRDTHRVETEIEAVRSGIDRIVLSSKESMQVARELGLEVHRLEACCAVPETIAEK